MQGGRVSSWPLPVAIAIAACSSCTTSAPWYAYSILFSFGFPSSFWNFFFDFLEPAHQIISVVERDKGACGVLFRGWKFLVTFLSLLANIFLCLIYVFSQWSRICISGLLPLSRAAFGARTSVLLSVLFCFVLTGLCMCLRRVIISRSSLSFLKQVEDSDRCLVIAYELGGFLRPGWFLALWRVSRISGSIAAFSLKLAVHIVPLGNLSMTLLACQIRHKIIISCPEVSSFDLLTPHKRWCANWI